MDFSSGKIFISYKKNPSTGGWFGPRRGPSFLPVAKHFRSLLEEKGYSVFVDQNIEIGARWFARIASELVDSELVLALLTKGTLKSHWVRTELMFADALGVRLLPLGCGISISEMKDELDEVGLSRYQCFSTKNHKPGREVALWDELQEHIEKGLNATRATQSVRFASLLKARNYRKMAETNQRAASYKIPNSMNRDISIHLAAGNLINFHDIDIIVNSENNYMQMARLIDGKTVSGLLRDKGAQKAPRRDSLQRELDCMLDEREEQIGDPPPAKSAEVLVTSSGHPDAELRRSTDARYVFHVAAAEVTASGALHPLSEEGDIKACTRNCIEAIMQLVRMRGVISPLGTPQRAAQEAFAEGMGDSDVFNVRSILFPLFGIGRGGVEPTHVARAMAEELSRVLTKTPPEQIGNLRDVYVTVFFEDDLDLVKAAFGEVLELQQGHGERHDLSS